MKKSILGLQKMKVEKHATISPAFSAYSIAGCLGNPIASTISVFLC